MELLKIVNLSRQRPRQVPHAAPKLDESLDLAWQVLRAIDRTGDAVPVSTFRAPPPEFG